MDRETYEQIARHLNDIDRFFEREAVEKFSLLEEVEPALAALAINALDGKEAAARWFGRRVIHLGWLTPWEVLAQGEPKKIEDLLEEISRGGMRTRWSGATSATGRGRRCCVRDS